MQDRLGETRKLGTSPPSSPPAPVANGSHSLIKEAKRDERRRTNLLKGAAAERLQRKVSGEIELDWGNLLGQTDVPKRDSSRSTRSPSRGEATPPAPLRPPQRGVPRGPGTTSPPTKWRPLAPKLSSRPPASVPQAPDGELRSPEEEQQPPDKEAVPVVQLSPLPAMPDLSVEALLDPAASLLDPASIAVDAGQQGYTTEQIDRLEARLKELGQAVQELRSGSNQPSPPVFGLHGDQVDNYPPSPGHGGVPVAGPAEPSEPVAQPVAQPVAHEHSAPPSRRRPSKESEASARSRLSNPPSQRLSPPPSRPPDCYEEDGIGATPSSVNLMNKIMQKVYGSLAEAFTDMDTFPDKKLTAVEWEQGMEKLWGYLSEDERRCGRHDFSQRMMRLFKDIDTDGDGKICLADLLAIVGRPTNVETVGAPPARKVTKDTPSLRQEELQTSPPARPPMGASVAAVAAPRREMLSLEETMLQAAEAQQWAKREMAQKKVEMELRASKEASAVVKDDGPPTWEQPPEPDRHQPESDRRNSTVDMASWVAAMRVVEQEQAPSYQAEPNDRGGVLPLPPLVSPPIAQKAEEAQAVSVALASAVGTAPAISWLSAETDSWTDVARSTLQEQQANHTQPMLDMRQVNYVESSPEESPLENETQLVHLALKDVPNKAPCVQSFLSPADTVAAANGRGKNLPDPSPVERWAEAALAEHGLPSQTMNPGFATQITPPVADDRVLTTYMNDLALCRHAQGQAPWFFVDQGVVNGATSQATAAPWSVDRSPSSNRADGYIDPEMAFQQAWMMTEGRFVQRANASPGPSRRSSIGTATPPHVDGSFRMVNVTPPIPMSGKKAALSTVAAPADHLVGKPVDEWDEADVMSWLSGIPSVPRDILEVVRKQAINGPVLLSLSERDLQALDIEKFGHRRLLKLAADELRNYVEVQRASLQQSGLQCSSLSSSYSIPSASMSMDFPRPHTPVRQASTATTGGAPTPGLHSNTTSTTSPPGPPEWTGMPIPPAPLAPPTTVIQMPLRSEPMRSVKVQEVPQLSLPQQQPQMPQPDVVVYSGVQLPILLEMHLRTLHPTQLREHAAHLVRIIGVERVGMPVPQLDHELMAWIIQVQQLHLEPLKVVKQDRIVSGSQPGNQVIVRSTSPFAGVARTAVRQPSPGLPRSASMAGTSVSISLGGTSHGSQRLATPDAQLPSQADLSGASSVQSSAQSTAAFAQANATLAAGSAPVATAVMLGAGSFVVPGGSPQRQRCRTPVGKVATVAPMPQISRSFPGPPRGALPGAWQFPAAAAVSSAPVQGLAVSSAAATPSTSLTAPPGQLGSSFRVLSPPAPSSPSRARSRARSPGPGLSISSAPGVPSSAVSLPSAVSSASGLPSAAVSISSAPGLASVSAPASTVRVMSPSRVSSPPRTASSAQASQGAMARVLSRTRSPSPPPASSAASQSLTASQAAPQSQNQRRAGSPTPAPAMEKVSRVRHTMVPNLDVPKDGRRSPWPWDVGYPREAGGTPTRYRPTADEMVDAT